MLGHRLNGCLSPFIFSDQPILLPLHEHSCAAGFLAMISIAAYRPIHSIVENTHSPAAYVNNKLNRAIFYTSMKVGTRVLQPW